MLCAAAAAMPLIEPPVVPPPMCIESSESMRRCKPPPLLRFMPPPPPTDRSGALDIEFGGGRIEAASVGRSMVATASKVWLSAACALFDSAGGDASCGIGAAG